jgi:hypothetical protein
VTSIELDEDLLERREAVFSDSLVYRYRLSRLWDPGVPPMVVIGLNPSTAAARADDPTIRRCRRFARREGCGGLVVVNLFGYRATDPADLKAAADPVGPDNDTFIRDAARSGFPVVAAWGAGGLLHGRDRAVIDAVTALRAPLWCLGLTRDGHPRHPLYLPAGAPLRRYRAAP